MQVSSADDTQSKVILVSLDAKGFNVLYNV